MEVNIQERKASQGHIDAVLAGRVQFEARMTKQLLRPDIAEIGHMHPERLAHIADVYPSI